MILDHRPLTIDHRASSIVFFMATLFLFVGCRGGVDPVIKIGMVAPFEGKDNSIGYDTIYSARLAVREINAQGGINGHRVALVAYNDNSYPEEAVNVAEALVIDENVVAVLGHWNVGTTEAAESVYAQANLAYVPMGTSEQFGTYDPLAIDETWRSEYQAISYLGQQPPGAWAGTAYDAMQLILTAIDHALETDGKATRATVLDALDEVSVEGLTGVKRLP